MEGTVKLDDKPLANVNVQFLPDASLGQVPGSFAKTDANGHYVARTSDGKDGVVVGKHTVLITPERADPRSGTPGSASVPTRYTQPGPDNPHNAVNVTANEHTYNFELKSK
jgi:hypothetical protein